MTGSPDPELRRRTAALAGLLIVQALITVFFAADAITDLRLLGPTPHTLLEGLVALALGLGIGITAMTMRRTIEEARRASENVLLARGAFTGVMERRFAGWRLSPAESEVAMLTLKGLDVAEIAGLRGSAPGTVRAQLAAVYRRAGVSGRLQFAALFLDDLIEVPET